MSNPEGVERGVSFTRERGERGYQGEEHGLDVFHPTKPLSSALQPDMHSSKNQFSWSPKDLDRTNSTADVPGPRAEE